jgi:nitrogen fixation protein NifB
VEQLKEKPVNEYLRVAVASYEGILVNQHLGMADYLLIFEVNQTGYRQTERRRTPASGNGLERWQKLAALVADCQALLVNSVGKTPYSILTSGGLRVYQVDGLIEEALQDLYNGAELRMPQHTAKCRCSDSNQAGGGCG